MVRKDMRDADSRAAWESIHRSLQNLRQSLASLAADSPDRLRLQLRIEELEERVAAKTTLKALRSLDGNP